ncbi:MAG: hypothetical protein IPL27_20970 [Lewinellaceae bacterium]|nr:hypothetical protein [Lewinellaceae bacterium]
MILLTGNEGLKKEQVSEDLHLHNFVWSVKQWDKDAGRPSPCCFWGVKQCNGFVKGAVGLHPVLKNTSLKYSGFFLCNNMVDIETFRSMDVVEKQVKKKKGID